jgi:hypothetical protein
LVSFRIKCAGSPKRPKDVFKRSGKKHGLAQLVYIEWNFAVSWIVMVDVVAYKRELSIMVFTPHGFIALLVATALLATLAFQFKRRAKAGKAWRELRQ